MQKRCAAFEALGSSFAAQLLTFKCCKIAAVTLQFSCTRSDKTTFLSTHNMNHQKSLLPQITAFIIQEFSALLQQRCLSLSKGFPLQRETAKICYCCSQPFYSSFVVLLEVILQRCSFRTGHIILDTN